ncbi:alpha/beta fold hydrolase [Cryptosporangium arvum]|uniref:Putative hydrolase or acyltransferase of alpha/beta superfamily n=1 Tax=Cryptosporangium arvum DSM 44712 TaxID=927661 RepID=A0A011AE14_9ACTN|nr:alpha/beta hydrolase [Cryptosporangium arvum]EXG80256.1 putative hydrolase or acyltransferase of alpha/beta superfamily [Cryptosporangium arvum DSM 44712]
MADITAHHGIFRDTKLHVDDTGGAGRPVVLVHGWPLSGESFKYNVPALEAAGYRVITYDRRGFGRSDKPLTGYSYDSLTQDLHTLLTELELTDVTVVGFSMGGGEVARYFTRYGAERLRSVVFASAVPPYLAKTPDNPEGPLEKSAMAKMTAGLTANQHKFYDQFITEFFSVNGVPAVTEAQRHEALELAGQSSKAAALEAMTAFGTTDFRDDLPRVSVPALVLHGDSDATVPFEGSGARTVKAVPHGELYLVAGGPHGCNVSHADEWNEALIAFLAK